MQPHFSAISAPDKPEANASFPGPPTKQSVFLNKISLACGPGLFMVPFAPPII